MIRKALVVDSRQLDWPRATPLQNSYRVDADNECITREVATTYNALRVVSTDGETYPVIPSRNGKIGFLEFTSDTLFIREMHILDESGKPLLEPGIEISYYEVGEGNPLYLKNGQEVVSVNQIATVAVDPQEVSVRQPRNAQTPSLG